MPSLDNKSLVLYADEVRIKNQKTKSIAIRYKNPKLSIEKRKLAPLRDSEIKVEIIYAGILNGNQIFPGGHPADCTHTRPAVYFSDVPSFVSAENTGSPDDSGSAGRGLSYASTGHAGFQYRCRRYQTNDRHDVAV